MLRRHGSSLVELVVSLTLGAVILSVATGSLLRQQRSSTTSAHRSRSAAQLRVATALVAAELEGRSAADLVGSSLRDTAMQLRAAVAAGFACDWPAEPAFETGGETAGGGALGPLHAGDSLWWFEPDSARWTGDVILESWTEAGHCEERGGGPAAELPATVRARIAGSSRPPAGTAVQVTRQERLVLYRSGDGSWQLGLRDWNAAQGAMASPQPVAGPLLRAGPGGERTGFRYFDAQGVELWPASDSAAGRAVARIRFAALAAVPGAGSMAARESIDVALAPSRRPQR